MTYIAKEQKNPPKTVKCLDDIETSSKFLLGLVNDVLDMSKVESGKIELHPEPYLAEEFQNYVESVIRPLCESKNQNFNVKAYTIDSVIPVMDILRFNQIIFNILSNAVKYTPEGGEISLAVENKLISENKERITTVIRDNGIGMDMGQCNDSYSAIKVAAALSEAFGCSLNELPLSFVISWYEQKAVCVLLSLLYLGIKDIYLGPTLPAFISPNVLDYLVEHYGISPITTPEADLKKMIG